MAFVFPELPLADSAWSSNIVEAHRQLSGSVERAQVILEQQSPDPLQIQIRTEVIRQSFTLLGALARNSNTIGLPVWWFESALGVLAEVFSSLLEKTKHVVGQSVQQYLLYSKYLQNNNTVTVFPFFKTPKWWFIGQESVGDQ